MSYIELVIKISEEDHERLKEYEKAPFNSLTSRVYEAIANGTPLPKGHGRLIDKNALIGKIHGVKSITAVLDAPTIIEADKEVRKLSFGDYDDVGVLNQFDNMTGSMNL